jgi:16S rRNA (guanine966-N2)-methyltransferase
MASRGLHVVAGSARGRRLVVPRGVHTRPTTGRVKEAVFSALDARGRVVGAAVLDLFAGSGSLAIEALSRGAARATLVDRDREALAAIAANLRATGFDDRATVERRAVTVVLRAAPTGAPFDLVFVDPPYDVAPDTLTAVLRALVTGAWLAPDATVVVEHGRDPGPVPGLRCTWSRAFGGTLVVFLEPEGSGTPAS